VRYVESINRALHELLAEHDDVFLIGEDLLDPYGGAFKAAKGLSSAYPERVLTTPISEAGITGVATGLALRGLRPIVEIMFGDFLALCTDQIVNHATKFSYMYNEQVRVPLVIRTPMGGYRGYGPTHSQTLEAMFMSVPRLTIVAPSHYHEPGRLLAASVLGTRDPLLFIENKLLYPQQLQEAGEDGRIGEFAVTSLNGASPTYPTMALSLGPGETPDVTLATYGGLAGLAADAAYQAFMEDEILVELLIPSLVSPVPTADILPSAQKSGRLLVLEEGVWHGGWGAELTSQVVAGCGRRNAPAIARMGAAPVPIPSAKSLERKVLPSVEQVLARIRTLSEA
jgi:pyruvate/2-oxoglutarate/acetoin dehydrogenase E1 component